VDILGGSWIGSNLHGGSTKNGTDVVGLLDALLGVPSDVVAVCKDSRAQRRAVITANTYHHQTAKWYDQNHMLAFKEMEIYSPRLRRRKFGLELKLLRNWLDRELTVNDGNLRTTVGKLGSNVLVRVRRVLGMNSNRMRTTDCRRVNWEHGFELMVRCSISGIVGRNSGRHCE